MPPAPCPYCDKLIDPKPTRKRKCPHCGQPIFVRAGELLTEFAAAVLDDQKAEEQQQRAAAAEEHARQKQEELFRFRRENREQQLRQIQDPDLIDTFPFLRITAVDDGDRCCPACKERHGKLIPTRQCTIEMLPPFDDCMNKDDGCRCMFIPVDKWST